MKSKTNLGYAGNDVTANRTIAGTMLKLGVWTETQVPPQDVDVQVMYKISPDYVNLRCISQQNSVERTSNICFTTEHSILNSFCDKPCEFAHLTPREELSRTINATDVQIDTSAGAEILTNFYASDFKQVTRKNSATAHKTVECRANEQLNMKKFATSARGKKPTISYS